MAQVPARRWSLAIGLGLLLCAPAGAQWSGFYTDEPGYRPGDTINIHAASETSGSFIFRLVKPTAQGLVEQERTGEVTVEPQITEFGSFVEFPTVSVGGLEAFTLEGWFHPTMVGTDLVVIAGQLGLSEAAAAIVVSEDGRFGAYASDSPGFDEANLLLAPRLLPIDRWYHLAASYDGNELVLYVDGSAVASAPRNGAIAVTASAFRLGARSEAPGDLTGIADGRLDSWALWPRPLDANEVADRYNRGLTEPDPTPLPSEVELYVGFEDFVGTGVTDGSANGHLGSWTGHGVQRVAGLVAGGFAARVQHDQMVDAGWPVVATIAIPTDLPSGLYAIQGLEGPGFVFGDDQAVVVRPADPLASEALIAVLVPTNTWVAYNAWPGTSSGDKEIPGITPRTRAPGAPVLYQGGNNSAYGKMGDGVSPAYFQGWRRVNQKTSVQAVDSFGYSVRAPLSVYLFDWLDRLPLSYAAYTDWDLAAGRIPLDGPHEVLLIHGHSEYWSQPMLDDLHGFLDAGGDVLSIAGNTIGWRVAHSQEWVMEVRKWPDGVQTADGWSAIDGDRIGAWRAVEQCRGTTSDIPLAAVTHLSLSCEPKPACFGRWRAQNTDHWLWSGIPVVEEQEFGRSPVDQIYVVGHEADSWPDPFFMPPGLAPGETPIVLAQGGGFRTAPGRVGLAEIIAGKTCTDFENLDIGDIAEPGEAGMDAGQIVYYPHQGGGHVLTIGSTASAWGLLHDPLLTRLATFALARFALGIDPDAPLHFPEPADDDRSVTGSVDH